MKKSVVIIFFTLIIMLLFYWRDRVQLKDNQVNLDPHSKMIEQNAIEKKIKTENKEMTDQPELKTDSKEAKELSPKNFSERLKEISGCLQLNNLSDVDLNDPTLDNLMTSLKPALGEMVVLTDDWTQLDVEFSDGIVKKIRTEINYDDPSDPTKYLQVYRMNAEGFPEMETIDEKQALNPSREYLDSLVAGSNIVLEEKGGRAYFQNGEELAIVERNGSLDAISLNVKNKTVSCTNLMNKDSSCQCY